MPSDSTSRPTSDAYREGWERTFGKRGRLEEFARGLGEVAATVCAGLSAGDIGDAVEANKEKRARWEREAFKPERPRDHD